MSFTAKWASRPHTRFGDPCFWCGIGMAPGSPEWLRKNGLLPEDMRQHGGHGLCTKCLAAARGGYIPLPLPGEDEPRPRKSTARLRKIIPENLVRELTLHAKPCKLKE